MPASQHQHPKSDIEISQSAKMTPIAEIARTRLGIPVESLEPYGHFKAKVSMDYVKSLKSRPNGKLILVSAITPTPAGEGKTTTTVGLGDALNSLGKKTIICLREPSLGPVFGMKGGAAGGGHAQVVPMEDINLHFTGDFSAVALANNLLAAMIDNHISHGNELGIDPRRITWKRVMDMNDRALRDIVVALGGTANGYPREDGFDIVVASEVMAIFCLATSLEDLKSRLGNIVVGYTRDQKPVRAKDLQAHGAMTVLLKDALAPNLVQTLENNPAFIHGGPFANIAHGCNSVIATQSALKLADYVVTEAGFGADLGAEKFLDIKCRKTGMRPNATVIVATIRALKYHGGVDIKEVNRENLAALEKGIVNLEQHVENITKVYGMPCVVSVNRFTFDTRDELYNNYEGWYVDNVQVRTQSSAQPNPNQPSLTVYSTEYYQSRGSGAEWRVYQHDGNGIGSSAVNRLGSDVAQKHFRIDKDLHEGVAWAWMSMYVRPFGCPAGSPSHGSHAVVVNGAYLGSLDPCALGAGWQWEGFWIPMSMLNDGPNTVRIVPWQTTTRGYEFGIDSGRRM